MNLWWNLRLLVIAKKFIWYGRKRHGGGVICYEGNNLSYDILSVFQVKLQAIEILLSIYRDTDDPSNNFGC